MNLIKSWLLITKLLHTKKAQQPQKHQHTVRVHSAKNTPLRFIKRCKLS